MNQSQPPKDSFTRLMSGPELDETTRVKKCTEAILAAMEQYDCEFQASGHFLNGAIFTNINILPIRRPNDSH